MKYAAPRAIALLLALCLALAGAVPAFAAGFNDVPKDHWAYEAIRKLVEKGYMDGFADDTFRGRKVITRYEMAITLAKLLDRVRDIETAGGVLSEADAKEIKRLSGEFRKELADLGVKLQGLETRVAELEKYRKDAEKVKIGGYYKASQRLVWDRFSTINDDDNWPDDEVDAIDENGLADLEQELRVKITGRPSEQIEAYMELAGILNQDHDQHWRIWRYEEPDIAQKSVTRPWLDKRLVDTDRDKSVLMDKAHLQFETQYAKIKAFAGESITRFNDPVNMLNGSGKNARYRDTMKIFQGVETTGQASDLSYQLSVLKERKTSPASRNVVSDDYVFGEYWDQYRTTAFEVYGARAAYKFPQKVLRNDSLEITLGGSFVEKAPYWKIGSSRGALEETDGADLSFKYTDIGTLKFTGSYLQTRNGLDADSRIIRDNGTKMDTEFSLDNLTLIVNHYNYGKEFFSGTTRWDSLYLDTGFDGANWRTQPTVEDKYWNYGRKGLGGEKLNRITVKYDQRFTDDQGLKCEGIAQQKRWKVDPTHQVYGNTAHMYSFQAWADMNKTMNSRAYTELKKDALKEEIGETWTEIEFNGRFPEARNLTGQAKFGTSSNNDDLNKARNNKRYNRWYGELGADVAPKVWAKLKGQREIDRIGWHDGNVDNPGTGNTERVSDMTGWEANLTLTSDLTLKFDNFATHDTWPNFPKENQRIHYFITEINKVFTDKLKYKARYWWKDYEKWSNNYPKEDYYSNVWANLKKIDAPTNANNLRNWTMELSYEPLKGSLMRVVWGDWIDSEQNAKDIETERKLYFELKSEF